MTLFVCATGTSIMGGPVRPAEFPSAAAQIEAKVARDRAAAKGNREMFLVRVSAETNGLYRAAIGDGDRVVFLASDTDEGRAAAERLVSLAEAEFGCHARMRTIQGLQMTDGKRFQREAIDALFTVLDEETRGESPDEVRINATGGFKGTLPYLVLYGMIERIEVAYVFEWSNALIRLPPLPIHFDWARLAGAAAAIFAICDSGALNEAAWRDLLPADYYQRQAEYDTLFQFEEGQVGLSGPGFLVKNKLEAAQTAARILLSPNAKAALDATDATVRHKYETILIRARNPLARRAGRHTERLTRTGSDLLVWKTVGHNPPRMLYWEDGDDVCVAELLLHDAYDDFWKREPRRRADYPLERFTAWEDQALPNYADLAVALRAADLADPDATEALQAELRRTKAEGDAARAGVNQARREARIRGIEQGRAEGARNAQPAIDAARVEAEAARRLAVDADARLAELEIYVALLEGRIGDAGAEAP